MCLYEIYSGFFDTYWDIIATAKKIVPTINPCLSAWSQSTSAPAIHNTLATLYTNINIIPIPKKRNPTNIRAISSRLITCNFTVHISPIIIIYILSMPSARALRLKRFLTNFLISY